MECQRKSPPKDYGQGKLQGNSISNIYEVTAFIDNYVVHHWIDKNLMKTIYFELMLGSNLSGSNRKSVINKDVVQILQMLS